MTIFVAIVLFYAVVLLSTGVALPVVNRLLGGVESTARFPLRGVLAMALGVAAFLVAFSLLARIIPDYRWTLPATFLLLGLVAVAVFRVSSPAVRSSLFLGRDALCLGGFLVAHGILWGLRWRFSDIHFDPGQFGAEKLFNLSLQQSFLFGNGYPPESLWLAGEREAYYILPRVLPGVSSFFARLMGAGVEVSGILFHLSDTFFHVLALAVTAAGALLFMRMRGPLSRLSWVLGLGVGLLPFLSAPLRAVHQVFSGTLELWSLSRIIPNTINEYPFWNYLWADNHAHSNGAFLDVSFLIFSLLFLLRNGENRSYLLGAVVGLLAAAVAMAQSGSVLILLCVLLPLGCVWLGMRLRDLPPAGCGVALKSLANSLIVPLATAVVVALPDVVGKPQPQVAWRLVPARMASDLNSYGNVFGVFLLLFVLVLLSQTSKKTFRQGVFPLGVCGLAALLLTAVVGYPVVGLAVLMVMFAMIPLWDKEISQRIVPRGLSLAALVGAGLVMLFPEVVAANFNMGEDYIRYNTVFKFIYAGFFLWPVLLSFAWAGAIPSTEKRLVSPRTLGVVALVGCLFLLFIQQKTWEHRLARKSNPIDISGLEFLTRERPWDKKIVDYLYLLPGRVVIAEECGMPPKPASYAVAGRISAYSGRPAVCGWGMHSYLHHSEFWTGPRKGQMVWSYLIKLNEELGAVFDVGDGSDAQTKERAREGVAYLHTLGVTHLVFGEWETALHPKTTLAALGEIGGSVVLDVQGKGVVEIKE